MAPGVLPKFTLTPGEGEQGLISIPMASFCGELLGEQGKKLCVVSESMCGPSGRLRGTLNVVEDEGVDWLGLEAVC